MKNFHVNVCGQTFEITPYEETVDEVKFVNFKTVFNDKSYLLKVQCDKEMIEDFRRLQGLNGEEELLNVLMYEIRLELYSLIRGVNILDVSIGKRIDLLPEFVKEFGVGYIELDVQEIHSDLIMEAMRHYGENL